jgi:Ser/Thr protein kinase RdoA (MazF antagonist)
MSITNAGQLKEYLNSVGIEFDTLEELGGLMNFVWRVRLKSGCSIIIKHAEPIAKSLGKLSFPVARMDFEACAMEKIPPLLSTAGGGLVNLPELYGYDKVNRVMTIADGGARGFRDAYSDMSLNICAFGRALGMWIASLHRETMNLNIGHNAAAEAFSRHPYNSIASIMEKYGFDPSLGKKISEDYGSLLQMDDVCVCHGDFTSPNVLVSEKGLIVIDWEWVRRGCGATDVGQFAASCYFLDRFRGGRGLLPAFLSGYTGAAKPDRTFVKRILVQYGVNIIFWPVARPEWGSDEETKKVVIYGIEVLKRAVDENWDWLRQSSLKEIIPDA